MHSRIKSITLMLMKWAPKLYSLLGVLALVISMPLAAAGTTYASAGCPEGCTGPQPTGSIGTFVYAEAEKNQLLNDVTNNTKDDTSFFQTDTTVYIKNPGSVPGGQPIQAAYNEARSQANASDRYSYGITYDCTASGISDEDLTPSTPHWTISYIVDQQLSKNFDSDEQIQGSAYYNHIVELPSGTSKGSDSHGPISTPQLGAPASCFPYTTGNITLDNYNQLSPANQALYPAQAATVAALGSTVGGGGGGGGPDSTCEASDSAGSFGWLLCPAIDLANNTIGTLVNQVIIPELNITPLTAGTGDEYNVWQSIRTLADVLFVLIFLVIIFANTVQYELNSYAIKKVLPKLVAAAILVQFSFILSALIIDIGNILGQGIAGLISVTITHPPPSGSNANPLLYDLGAAFSTAALIGAISTIAVPTIVLAVVSGLISVIGVVFTLVARQLIIIMLVVLSPLAFAAFVLPNTERYFSVWLKMFIRISLMYPLIILLLNVAIIGQNASKGGSLEALLAVIFPIIAFFMIPMTFKWAGGAMAFAATAINKLGNKANGGVQSGVKNSDAYKGYQERRAERKAQKLSAQTTSDNPLRAYLGGVRQRGAVLGNRRFSPVGALRGQPLPKDPIAMAQQRTQERASWESAKKIVEGLPDKELSAAAKGEGAGTNPAYATAAQAVLASKGRLPDDTLLQISRSGGSEDVKQRRLDYVRGAGGKDIAKSSPVRAMAPMTTMSFGVDGKLSDIKMNEDQATGLKQVLGSKSATSLLDMSGQGVEDLGKTKIFDASGVERSALTHIDQGAIAGIADPRNLSKMSKDMYDKLDVTIRDHGTSEQKKAWHKVQIAVALRDGTTAPPHPYP